MTPQEFNQSIRGTQAILRECELLRATAALQSAIGSAEFRELALTPGTAYGTYTCAVCATLTTTSCLQLRLHSIFAF